MRMSSMAAAAAATVVFSGFACGVASAAPPKCSDVPGTLVGSTCQVQITDPGYTVSIGFPADFPDQKAVQEYVKQTRDGFLNVARGGDARTAPYALEIKSTEYNSAVPPRGTQSVVLEAYESVGGAHPTTFYKAFNWDQGYRKPITIETLFAEGVDPYPVLLPLVQEQVATQFGDAVAFPATVDPTVFQNFALTNDHLIFFFDRGAVLPDAVGAFEVSIPRETVNPLLA
jgi:hypothetical protein